jgi:hypothetical protein
VHELIAWCFHSPRRLLAVGAVAIALLLAGAVMVQTMLSDDGHRAGGVPSAVTAPAGTGAALSAAVEFTRRWASVPPGQTVEQWRAGMAGRVTSDLASGLALTDPAALPGGTPVGQPVVRFVSVASALVEVPLSSGRHVLVSVVLSGKTWLASDVQPLEGNAGDVPVDPAGSSAAGSSGGGEA